MTVTRHGLNVVGEGDVDKASLDFSNGTRCEVELSEDQDTYTSLYPLDYLEAFLKGVKGERLVLHLGTDYPVRADWDGVTKGAYLCAPRIETTE